MKKYKVYLSREYVVEIEANDKDDALSFTEQYVSGGNDDSMLATRKKYNFNINHIKPTLNEAFCIEEIIS